MAPLSSPDHRPASAGARRTLPAGLVAWAPAVSRVLAAVVGGYALAALTSVAAQALPGPAVETAMAGMLLSFLVLTGAVIWVYAVRSATRAWAGLAVAAVPLAAAAALVWSRTSA